MSGRRSPFGTDVPTAALAIATGTVWAVYLVAMALVSDGALDGLLLAPVVATAVLWGPRFGAAAGVAAVPLQLLTTLALRGPLDRSADVPEAVLLAVTAIALGALVGRAAQRRQRLSGDPIEVLRATRELVLHLNADGVVLAQSSPRHGLFAPLRPTPGHSVRDILWGPVATVVLDRLDRVMSNPDPRAVSVYQSVELDGEEHVLEVRTAPAPDRTATVTLADVTRARRSEAQLRFTMERYSLAIQGAKDGMWDWNVRTGSVYWSHRWRTMVGPEVTDTDGTIHEWLDQVHPSDRARVSRQLDELFRGDEAHFESEHRVRNRHGAWRWMLARGITQRDAQGLVTRIAGSFTDITDLRQTAAIHEKSALLEHATRAIGVGIAVVNPRGHLAQTSPTLQKMTSSWAAPDEWWQDIALDMARPAMTRCSTCGLAEFVDTLTIERAAPNGDIHVFELVFTGHGHDVTHNQPSHVVLVRDVTRRSVDEQRLRQLNAELARARDRALEGSRAKSTFLANMSHELRTPLTAILGYAEMLLEDAEDAGQAEAISDLQRIHHAGSHLLRLIGGILDLSKIEAGKMEMHVERVRVVSVVQEVSSTVEGLVADHRNRLVVHVDPGIGEMTVDQTKLAQILFNLLSNAAKFTEDGEVRVDVSMPESTATPLVRFTVSDSGVGMTEEQSRRLFEEFYQVDASSTKRHGGSGLGLAITKRFCLMMGGTIAVESQAGKGTTFVVTLPRHADPDRSASTRITRPAAMSRPLGRLVLAADDDPGFLEFLTTALEDDDTSVAHATNAGDALRLAMDWTPDLILLDIVMPERDGWSVLQDLKAHPELRNVPVVIVTSVDDRRLAYAMGAAEYLIKPITSDEIRTVAHRLLHTGETPLALFDPDPGRREATRGMLVDRGWGVILLDDVDDPKATDAAALVVSVDPDADDFAAIMRQLRDATAPAIVLTERVLDPAEHLAMESVRRVIERPAHTMDLPAELRSAVAQLAGAPRGG